ncbi:MAG: bifunctional demethylmenaquinone methyltransferase/2-methoxy-6-polyprenyl-1,4-benzoquinol methylase UbiE [Alphaproteobacteria bacterium]
MVPPSANHPSFSSIKDLFDQVAPRYNLMNDVMSIGIQRYWKRVFVNMIPQLPQICVLDLACGTGDIGFGYLKKSFCLNPSITLCDVSPEMLKLSKEKAINQNIKNYFLWKESPAESLDFPDDCFHVCTVAFGLRNFVNRSRALAEIYRILKPGGTFLCLEFSQPEHSISSLYNLYLSTIIPKAGKLVGNNEEAYTYLVKSIQQFPGVEPLKNMIEKEGFKSVTYKTLSKGIVAIHRGWK